MKTRVSLKYFETYLRVIDSGNSFLIVTCPGLLQILVTLRPFTLSSKKVPKFALLDNGFSELFTEVEIWY